MNKKIIFAIIILCIIIGVAAFVLIENSVYYDSSGTVLADESNLTLKYNNDESIYGYYSGDGSFSHIMYYDEKILNGVVKLNLSKVKWNESYKPSHSRDDINYVNDVNHANNDFPSVVLDDYANGNVKLLAYIYFYDKKGHIVYLEDHSFGFKNSTSKHLDRDNITYKLDTEINDVILNDDLLTIKLFKNYQVNASTYISNDADYKGALVNNKSNVDDISTARLEITFYNDNYSYKVSHVLNGTDISLIHM